ncbi:MAG: hypothetical protein GX129_01890 [Clostridiales bacterium]|jgi:hypothetical protein|nr:hypothetical protein [Clostridiales bacterium]
MKGTPNILDNQVGLFFVVHDEFLLHSCILDEAEPYGDFLNYPLSHDKVWSKYYLKKYHVDFDYFPRGRIVYNKVKDSYILYYDECIEDEVNEIKRLFLDKECIIAIDEHYQCHNCNTGYVI